MAEIIPAILPKDFAEIEEKMTSVIGLVPLVQIDICDGTLTPERTWPHRKHDENFDAILKEERGMPAWEDVDFEIDLMVKKPEEQVLTWVGVGATRIIAHIEGTENFQKVIDELKGFVEIGIALNIDTPIEKIKPFLGEVDFVQCMGIAQIGFQGQPFDERVLEKISTLRKDYPELTISVDGGVNLETAPKLIAAGAHRLVAGSAIFGSENAVEAIRQFESL
jgi:ribulose-phosphate 3-epimerase